MKVLGGRHEALARYAVIFAVVAATAGLDLWSKRWAEANLATDRHLLPVPAGTPAAGATVGDVVRARFPSLEDAGLNGAVSVLPPVRPMKPDDRVFSLEESGVELQGFLVDDGGAPGPFVRRLDRSDQFGIERWVMRARPDLGFQDARKLVRERLKDVTLRDWLGRKLPGLSGDELDRTIASGLHPIPKTGVAVDPAAPAVEGRTYLVGDRDIVLIQDHLDVSYAENPFGAWSMLSEVDDETRRAIFYVLSALAIAAVGLLLVRPPTRALVPMIALGAILGGAIGNLADRLTLTYVVDFIHMWWGGKHWPRYNVADIGITVGVIVLVLFTGGKKKPADK